MKKDFINKLISILLGFSVLLLIITFSIGLPIYIRPFYYLHINALDLPNKTGYSYETIKEAYDTVLDFLTLNKDFSTGKLLYSTSGKNHFVDCKFLFDLNFYVLLISSIIVISIILLKHFKKIEIKKLFGFSPVFYASIFINIIIIAIVTIASTDFDKAFTVFHNIFFHGKDNWIFNSKTDQIINILPQDFFMNCAILIASSIIIITFSNIIVEIIKRKKQLN
ncbi:MAG: TIGR01906 family membrane protein [Bacilli bacterium]|nr:TIGR01906 family membrane protein [Bacilli bacterium]